MLVVKDCQCLRHFDLMCQLTVGLRSEMGNLLLEMSSEQPALLKHLPLGAGNANMAWYPTELNGTRFK